MPPVFVLHKAAHETDADEDDQENGDKNGDYLPAVSVVLGHKLCVDSLQVLALLKQAN